MNHQYLIPANTKRSMLIFGLFKPIDLIIFVVGLVLTGILVAAVGTDTPAQVIIGLAPLLIASLMVSREYIACLFLVLFNSGRLLTCDTFALKYLLASFLILSINPRACLVEIDFENSTLSIRMRSSESSNSLERRRYPFSVLIS